MRRGDPEGARATVDPMRLSPRTLVAGLAAVGLTAAAGVVGAAPAAAAAPAWPYGSGGSLAVSCASAPKPCTNRGPLVEAVQRALVKRGYRIGTYTLGVYGTSTAAAVQRYKSGRATLGTSNMVGPRTYASITAVLQPSAPSPGVPSSSPRYDSISDCRDLPNTTPSSLTRSQRAQVTLARFVRSKMGCQVVVRESGGSCTISNPSGKYLGKWQLDMYEWNKYGGVAFAPRPNRATCAEQDLIAYRNWRDRGWSPWTTAY